MIDDLVRMIRLEMITVEQIKVAEVREQVRKKLATL